MYISLTVIKRTMALIFSSVLLVLYEERKKKKKIKKIKQNKIEPIKYIRQHVEVKRI